MHPPHPAVHELELRAPRAILIGGSAGGVEAVRALLPSLPMSLQAPVLVVLHLAPDTRTNWSVIFSHCKLPVEEAEDKARARPGVVYVAPSDYHLLIDRGGVFSFSVDPPVNLSRPSIDVLFESAAWAYAERTLGILLTGANDDGAAGLAAIHAAGGLAWVQSPDTAAIATMPRAGLRAVPRARSLAIPEMARIFQSLNTELYRQGS